MAERRLVVAAAAALFILAACVDRSSPNAGESASSPVSPTAVGSVDLTPPASIASVSPSGSQPALNVTLDPSLEASLPERVGGLRYARHTLLPGARTPEALPGAVMRAVARALGGKPVSIAWSAPAAADTDPRYLVTLIAIRAPGTAAERLREPVMVERMLEPGFTGDLAIDETGGRSMVFVGDLGVMSSADTLYLLSFPPPDVPWTPPPGPEPTPPFSYDELLAALPQADPQPTRPPGPPPVPIASLAPGVSPPPDPAAEALLPERIDDHPVLKVSGRGPGLFRGDWVYISLPAYSLSLSMPVDLMNLSAAGGHPDGLSTYWIVATPLPGVDARTILGAWFRTLIATGASTSSVESVGADGRMAILYGSQAVYARDGVLYWMTYLDVGDFPPASPPPRPALRDLVIETLRALP